MKHILFLLFLLTGIDLFCQVSGNGNSAAKQQAELMQNLRGNGLRFTENKGQIVDMDGNLRHDILFKGDGGGTDIYIRKTGISYVLSDAGKAMGDVNTKIEEMKKSGLLQGQDEQKIRQDMLEKEKIRIQRIDAEFVNANPNPKTTTSDQADGYSNYYYGHCPQGITHVLSYNEVTEKNIYHNIDVKYYGGKERGLEYDLIVNPGGNPNDIKLKYSGADELMLEDGKLKIKTSFGQLAEYMPKVYQIINGKVVDVKAEYELKSMKSLAHSPYSASNTNDPALMTNDYIVTFQLSNYQTDYPLIIDPYWATYYGGNQQDQGIGIATDNVGNVVITGYTDGGTFPANNAGGVNVTWQGAFGSVSDAYVVKFDPNGNRLWATYYGGNQSDGGAGIATDPSGNVVITGYTAGAFPANNAGGANVTWQGAYGGGSYDAFAVKFDPNGMRLWATYYGGNQYDYGTNIATDASGNVVITGFTAGGTFSANNAGGANVTWQGAYGGGTYDAFVVKFDANGNRLWATYYGGNQFEAGIGIATDLFGNVVITGSTAGGTFPANNAGGANVTWQGAYGGGTYDAFVVKFDANGNRLWATYYGGNQEDQGAGIATDPSGNVVITGWTAGGTFPANNAGGANVTWQGAYGGGIDDAFVLKFDSNGMRLWATYYGGNQDDRGRSIATDANNNIYLLMETEDAPGFGADACSYNPVFNGGSATDPYGGTAEDQLIVKFSPEGKKKCATYMGGIGEDDLDGFGGNGIVIYGNSLYITGYTDGGYPVTTGAAQTVFGGGGWDAFVASLCTNICEGKTLGLDFASATNVCVNTAVTYTPSISNSCDTTAYKFHWLFAGGNPAVSDSVNPTITYPAAGTYSVELVVTTTCKKDSVIKTNYITVTSCGSITATVNSALICSGVPCPVLTATGSSGTSPYTYLWNTGATGSSVTPSPCPTATTNYTVTVTDNTGATATAVSTVTVNPVITPTVTVTNLNCNALCNGGAIVTISGGTPGYTYTWNTTPVQTANNATGLCAGNYTCTITDAGGCSATQSVTITQPPALTASVTTSTAACLSSTGSATVTPSGGTPAYTYLWSPSGGTNASATGLSAGSYTCTISDAGGCTKTSVANISTLTSPTVTVVSSASVSCNGGSSGSAAITVSGGTAPYTYLWCNAQTSSAVSGLSAGVCNVTVTDNAGCVGITTVSITQPTALTASATATNLLCSGSSAGTATVTPSGGTPGYSYLWNPSSQTNSTATNLSAGNYSVTITDANGCTVSQSVSITAPTAITASVTTNNAPCLTASGTATVTPSGGTPAYTYFWSPSGGTNATATGLSAGSYTVTITDANGCSETTTANISNTGSPWGYISSVSNVACNGLSSGVATVTVTIGTAPYTYVWDNGQTTASATGLGAGSHQVTITDGLGCIVIVDTVITQPPALSSSVTATQANCGKPDGTASVTAAGGTPGYSYLWNPASQTTSTATNLSAGNYSVTITDANGCTSINTVTVTSSPSVTAAAGPNSTICSGQMLTLNSSGGTNYLWSNGNTTSAMSVSPGTSTTYSVIVSNGACADTASVTVTVNPSPTVSIAGNTLLCKGDIATLTASGGTTYLWSNGNTSTAIIVSPGSTTTYSVSASNGNCTSSASVTVIVSPPPIASAASATICSGQNATLTPSGGGTYLWSNGNTTSSIQVNPTANSTYSVIVSIGTCSDTASATVTVNALPTAVAWSSITITAGMSTTLNASGGVSYSWSSGASGSAITVSPAITTIYCVWVSNNDCRDSACVTVTVEPMDCSEAATGKLYLPDAFSPNNDGENDFLRIYFGNMLCIKSFELHIYNRWGEQVFETNDPDFRWDGSYKSKPQNTAVFVYYMNATLITGEKIIRKGNVGLLR